MPVTPQKMFGERGLWFVLRHPGKERFIAICIETLIEENETINDKYASLLVPDPPEPIEYEEGTMSHAMISYDIPAIHARWLNEAKSENLEHPVAVLTAAWQKTQPLHVKQDQNNNAIMPQTFAIVHDIHLAEGALFAELPASTRPGFSLTNSQEDLFADLPGFEPRGTGAVPSLPLVLFDAAGGESMARGRGAPLALRLWVEAILSVPIGSRSGPRPVRLEISLRDLILALWPNGWTGPGRDGPKLRRALLAVHNARIPWENGTWAAVVVRNTPDMRNLASPLVLEVSLPPGSEAGPMVYRPMLRKYGVQSAAAFRLTLTSAYLWNRYLTVAGKRLPPTVPVVKRSDSGHLIDNTSQVLMKVNGNPATHWNDPRAMRTGEKMRNPELNRLPWLTAVDLIEMGAAETQTRTSGARRKALHDVRGALRLMHKNGDLVTVVQDERCRIEPPDWWGNPKGAGKRACNG